MATIRLSVDEVYSVLFEVFYVDLFKYFIELNYTCNINQIQLNGD